MQVSSVLLSLSAVMTLAAPASDFQHQFSLINDNSRASGFRGEQSQASRALLSWDWQYELRRNGRWPAASKPFVAAMVNC